MNRLPFEEVGLSLLLLCDHTGMILFYFFFHVTQVECIIYRYFYVRSSYLLTLFSLTETQGVFLLVFYAHSFFLFFLKLSLVLTLYLQQGSSHCHGHDFVGMILHYTEYKAQ